MKKRGKNCENLSSVSIQKAPAQNVLSDTHEDEEEQVPVLDVEALRTIARLVRTITKRIEANRSETGSGLENRGDSGSSAPASPDHSEDHGRKKEQNR